jgi:hypothetical protein
MGEVRGDRARLIYYFFKESKKNFIDRSMFPLFSIKSEAISFENDFNFFNLK